MISTRDDYRRSRVRVFVEVLIICDSVEFGHPRWLDLLLEDHDPVDTFKPDVGLNVFCSPAHAAQSLRHVLFEQATDEFASVN